MPSKLMNEKDIFCKNLCPTLFCLFHLFRQNKNLEQSGIRHFLYHKLGLISIPQNQFTLHLIPGKRNHIISLLVKTRLILSRINGPVDMDLLFGLRMQLRNSLCIMFTIIVRKCSGHTTINFIIITYKKYYQ